MPAIVYNEFINLLTAGSCNLQSSGQVYGVILVSTGYVFDPTHVDMTDVTNEFTDSSYSRKYTTLDGFSIDADDNFLFAFNNVSWFNLTSTVALGGAILVKLAGSTFGVPANDKLLAYFALTSLPAAFTHQNYSLRLNNTYLIKLYGN